MGLKITAKTKLQIGHLLSVTQDSLKPLINNELIYNLKIINFYVYLSTKESDKLKFFFRFCLTSRIKKPDRPLLTHTVLLAISQPRNAVKLC